MRFAGGAQATAPWAVECAALGKRFGSAVAVDGLTLCLPRGALYALLGRNGAGKTTTVGMLATIVAPTSGSATVDGLDVRSQAAAVRERVGLVLQEPALDRYLSVIENLTFLARAYRIERRLTARRVGEALELLGLGDQRHVVVGALSGGNKRRVEMAAGVLHRPVLLLLDEPTVGLDVEARQRIWEHVRSISQAGTAVILTTHYLEEADMLADVVGIMDHGRLVAEGPPDILKRAVRREVTLRLMAPAPDAALRRLAACAEVVEEGRGALRLRPLGLEGERALLAVLADEPGLEVAELRLGLASLDEVFLATVASTGGSRT